MLSDRKAICGISQGNDRLRKRVKELEEELRKQLNRIRANEALI